MEQEEKELLLKDLSARLPYGVICYWRIGSELTLNLTEYNGLLTCINKVNIEGSNEFYWDCYFDCNDSNGNSFQNEDVQIDIVKPYLRPIHKLTKEELEELEFLTDSDYVDYCNKHHIDYRNLIPKGLALEAPEDMYDTNQKWTTI